jgi:hypothetical protein
MEQTAQEVANRPAAQLRGWPDNWFYFFFGWLVAAIVVYGFAHTITPRLLHPPIPRPLILWVHATVFFAWIGLFIVQTSLVRSRNVRWHRTFGVAILILGAALALIGVATSLAMSRFDIAHGLHDPVFLAAFLSIPFNDMVLFSGALAAAFWWRKRPDVHRRLMLVATCLLTPAAFSRFPFVMAQAFHGYVGVDVLIAVGCTHDLVVHRRVHSAYTLSLPAVLLGQVIATWLFLGRPDWWIEFAQRLLG